MVRLGRRVLLQTRWKRWSAPLTAAEPLRRLRQILPPKPIAEFSEPDLDRLAEALNEIRRVAPSQIQSALTVVMSQMAEPWSISAVLENLATTGRFRSSAGVSGFRRLGHDRPARGAGELRQ